MPIFAHEDEHDEYIQPIKDPNHHYKRHHHILRRHHLLPSNHCHKHINPILLPWILRFLPYDTQSSLMKNLPTQNICSFPVDIPAFLFSLFDSLLMYVSNCVSSKRTSSLTTGKCPKSPRFHGLGWHGKCLLYLRFLSCWKSTLTSHMEPLWSKHWFQFLVGQTLRYWMKIRFQKLSLYTINWWHSLLGFQILWLWDI